MMECEIVWPIICGESYVGKIGRSMKVWGSWGSRPRRDCWISKFYVTSENAKLDGREMELEAALKETVGYQMGTLISCVRGRLAYFEDEDGGWILERVA